MHSPNGIEKEFINYLPEAARHTKQYLSKLEEDGSVKKVFKRFNDANNFHSLGKIMLEAWKHDMVSVSHEKADVAVEKGLEDAGINEEDLPQTCLKDEEVEMVWQRHLDNEMKFATERLDISSLRRQFNEEKGKLCSVDTTAVLNQPSVREIFDDCIFHSKYFIKDDLKNTERLDPKWIELGCSDV
jgi:hypothetical protein